MKQSQLMIETWTSFGSLLLNVANNLSKSHSYRLNLFDMLSYLHQRSYGKKYHILYLRNLI